MPDDTIPENLAEAVSNGQVILFAGSGLSATSGVPLWKVVTEKLIGVARANGSIDDITKLELQETSDLREVADHLIPTLSPTERADFFRKHFSTQIQSASHQLLSDLGIKKVITTNWDCMAERMIQMHTAGVDPNRPWQNQWTSSFTGASHDRVLMDAARKNEIDSWVFHMHGIYYRPDTVVWEKGRFADVLDDEFTNSFLTDLLRDNVVLYVGYSMADSDFQTITERIFRKHKESMVRHFAILPNIPPTRRALLLRNGITAISYETPGISNSLHHSEGLERILSSLLSKKIATAQTANISQGRSNGRIHQRFNEMLRNHLTDSEFTTVKIYGSAGRDFLREYEIPITQALEKNIGIQIQILLLDPRVEVKFPNRGPICLQDWRHGGAVQSAYSTSEYAEFVEAQEIIKRMRRTRPDDDTDSGISVRYSSTFPRNTICAIGRSVFDCPRPVLKLSIQGPIFEYRHGSQEYDFFLTTFNQLWETSTSENVAAVLPAQPVLSEEPR